jgi:hypothetical protein
MRSMTARPLYPQERRFGLLSVASRSAIRRLSPPLLDDFVGLYKKRLRQAKAESFCGFQVDYHFEFGRQLNWKFVCFRSPQYAVDVRCRTSKQIARVNAVGKQPPLEIK